MERPDCVSADRATRSPSAVDRFDRHPAVVNAETTIRVLDAADGEDAGLLTRLVDLVNEVDDVAEAGLWKDGATRTTAPELAELIRAGEIVVATRGGGVVGCVRLHDVSVDTSELGMLVAAPDQRSTGVGRALVDHVERRGRERALRAVRLEIHETPLRP